MQFYLESISQDDRESVIDIFNHYVEYGFAAYPERTVPYEFFDALLQMAHGYPAVVAKDEHGKTIGFGMLRAHNPVATFSHTAEITYFIEPEYTGRGIGTSILEHLIEEGKKRGVTSILASISSLNQRSIGFHRKRGFNRCGCFEGICKKKGQVFDVVWMQRII
jgi:L-amino acid N-acyltransferase YncA